MDLAVDIINRFEQWFDAMGLMTGWLSPFLRGAVAFGAVSLIEFAAWKWLPTLFDEAGNPRPWAYFTDEKGSTLVPWYLPAGIAAIFIALFV